MKNAIALCVSIMVFVSILSGCACIPTRVPEYEAKVSMFVNNADMSNSTSIDRADIISEQSMISTYRAIILTDGMRMSVIEYSGVTSEFTTEVQPVEDSGVFKIVVKSVNAEDACKVANAYGEIVPRRIADIVEGSSVRIVDEARIPEEPASYRWSFGN